MSPTNYFWVLLIVVFTMGLVNAAVLLFMPVEQRRRVRIPQWIVGLGLAYVIRSVVLRRQSSGSAGIDLWLVAFALLVLVAVVVALVLERGRLGQKRKNGINR